MNHLDITERKAVELNLQQSESRFKMIFENAPISIWEEDFSLIKERFDSLKRSGVHDFEDYFEHQPDEIKNFASLVRIIDINNNSVKFFEIDHNKDIPLNLNTYFTDALLRIFKEELIALANGQTYFKSEIPIQTSKGEYMQLLMHLGVVPGYEKTLGKVLVFFIDISQLARSQKALAESESRFRIIFEQIGVGVASLDIHGRFSKVNHRFCDMLGYTQNEMQALTFLDITHPEDLNESNKQVRQLLENTIQMIEIEKRYISKDGSFVWGKANVSLLRSESGDPIQFIAVIEDISKGKEAEKSLQTSMLVMDDLNKIVLEQNENIVTTNRFLANIAKTDSIMEALEIISQTLENDFD